MKTAAAYLVISVGTVAAVAVLAFAWLALSGRLTSFAPPSSAATAEQLQILASGCGKGGLNGTTKSADGGLAPRVAARDVASWASVVVPRIMTFGYLDYYKRLKDAKSSFSADGWCKFLDDLTASDLLAGVVDLHLHFSLVFRGNVEVEGGVFDQGLYVWSLKVPAALEFTGGSSPALNRPTIGVLKMKVLSTLDGGGAQPGFRIEQMIFLPSH